MQKKLLKGKSQMQQHDFNNRIKKGLGGGGSADSPSIGMLNGGVEPTGVWLQGKQRG